MALVVAKKMAVASAMAVGSGYTGAVVYGSKDEHAKGLMERYLPGYSDATAVYQRAGALVGRLLAAPKTTPADGTGADPHASKSLEALMREREVLLSTMARMAADFEARHVAQLREVQSKYTRELDEWRGRLLAEKEESLARELVRKEELDAAVASYKMEQEFRLSAEIERVLEAERQARVQRQHELAAMIEELEARTSQLVQKYRQTMKSGSLATVVESLGLVLGDSHGHGHGVLSNRDLLLRNLHTISARSEEEAFVRSVCESLLGTVRQVPASGLDRGELRRELQSLQPAALEYADFAAGSTWLEIFLPVRAARDLASRLLGRAPSMRDATQSTLRAVDAFIQEGDLENALRTANQIDGWPRVVLKEWIGHCRRILELEQGLSLLRSYLLAVRLAEAKKSK